MPPKGIDVSWIRWEQPDIVVAEFVCSELHPNPIYRKTAQDLRHEVGTTFRHRILTDNLTNYPLRSRRMMTLYTVLEHPWVTASEVPREIKRAADAATEVVDVEMTKEQVDYMHQISGIKKGTIEPKEVRHKRLATKKLGDTAATTEQGPLQEIQVMSVGMVDSG